MSKPDKPEFSRKPKKQLVDADNRPLPSVPSHDIPVKQFFATVDREKLEWFLSENDKYEGFLAALKSEQYAAFSFARIMAMHHVTLHELNTIYQDGNRAIGLFSMAGHLPKIMEDVAVSAESKDVCCPRCDGDGIVPVSTRDEDGNLKTKTCPDCKGNKVVIQTGDKHSIDVVFETMKLTGIKGPMVAIQNNQFALAKGGAGLDSSMEDMLRLTQTVTMGERNREEEPA